MTITIDRDEQVLVFNLKHYLGYVGERTWNHWQ